MVGLGGDQDIPAQPLQLVQLENSLYLLEKKTRRSVSGNSADEASPYGYYVEGQPLGTGP